MSSISIVSGEGFNFMLGMVVGLLCGAGIWAANPRRGRHGGPR